MLFISSCGRDSRKEMYNAHKKIADMKSYSALADITVYGNKGTSSYKVRQYFLEPNKLRVETLEPEFIKGKISTYNGVKWKIYHPIIKKTFEMDNLKNDDELIYLGIIQKSILAGEDAEYEYTRKDENDFILVKSTIPGGSKYRNSVQLYMTKNDLCPKLMEILDDKGQVKVLVKYSEFDYNRELKDSLFNLE